MRQRFKSNPFPGGSKAGLSSIYISKKGKDGNRRGLSKVLYGRLYPEVQPVFLKTIFDGKRYFFRKPSFDNYS